MTRLRALEARLESCDHSESTTLLDEYTQTLALLPSEYLFEAATAHLRLAMAMRQDAESCAREAAVVLELVGCHFPRERCAALGLLGAASLAQGDAEAALRSLDEACALSEAIFDSACIVPSLRIEAVATDDLHLRAAGCLLRLGRHDEALLRSERGRSRVLAEDLIGAETDTSGAYHAWLQSVKRIGYSSREYDQDPYVIARAADERAVFVRERRSANARELALSDVRALVPPGGALVVMLEHDRAADALVVTRDTETIREHNRVPLDLDADDRWAGVMGPVFDRLVELRVPTGAHVILVPTGRVRDLPLHAASRPHDGRPRPFLIDYVVSYAQSLLQLQVSQRRAAERGADSPSLTLISNPTNDLPHALVEGAAIAALFPEPARHIHGVGLDRLSVWSDARRSTYVHFACHASLNAEPDVTALHLGGMTPMTIGDIRDFVQLENARLVTLSACTTGTASQPELASEQIGLVETLLRAGAATVVASLWPVDDLATRLLMEEFYRHLVESRLSPPAALRAAQLWLREQPAGTIAPSLIRDVELPGRSATETRYSDPYYWAGFRCIGV
jgi:tetratricopeptide (TPR) repeat protein